MAHITLPEGLPGITGPMAYRPETAKYLRALAEVLLRGPNPLTSGERELVAPCTSRQNECYFCQTSHGAAASHHYGGNLEMVDQVKCNFETAPISEKLKALLAIAGQVQKDGKTLQRKISLAQGMPALPTSRFMIPF